MGVPEDKDLLGIADEGAEIHRRDILGAGIDPCGNRDKARGIEFWQCKIVPEAVEVEADKPAVTCRLHRTGEDTGAVTVTPAELDDQIGTIFKTKCVELQPLQDTEIAGFVGDQPKLIKPGPKRNCCGELPVKTKRRVTNGS